MAGKQAHFKPWRLPVGRKIPLDEPFRASDVGISGSLAKMLSNEGFLEPVGWDRKKGEQSPRRVWRATSRLREYYERR